jgi:cytochrome c peroxidase
LPARSDAGGKETNGPRRPTPAPVTDSDYYDDGHPDASKVELGRLLFFDKLLSGNENISCATCHHSLTDTGDGLSLGVGEGGRGLGITRDTGSDNDAIHERVPRNAPPVFNLGAREFRRMFHDGRVEVDNSQPSGFRSPAGGDLPLGLDNVLAAQAMFPVTSTTEMAGQGIENQVAIAAEAGNLPGVWELLAARLRANQIYVDLFEAAFTDIGTANEITFTHAANAIAAFESQAWRADNSPYDRYLRKEPNAMSLSARKGMKLFYGKAGCAECHSGKFQTDHQFHAVAMPQIGPGKGDGSEGHEDFGREQVTGDSRHRYTFRTPTLRNVTMTGPWGHSGAYNDLKSIARHMIDPEESLYAYNPDQAVLPYRWDLDQVDFEVLEDPEVTTAVAGACELEPVNLSEEELDQVIDFLWALTDPASVDLRDGVPENVPSGLPLAD